jgi:hypothetical protein
MAAATVGSDIAQVYPSLQMANETSNASETFAANFHDFKGSYSKIANFTDELQVLKK